MSATNDNVRIDNTTGVFMVIVAIFFDLLSLIPVLNGVSLVIGNGLFWFWFKVKGVGFMSPKKLAVAGGETLTEAAPALFGLPAVLPAITVGVILLLLITRTEDKTGLSVSKPTQKKARIGDIPKVANENRPKKNFIPKERFQDTETRRAA